MTFAFLVYAYIFGPAGLYPSGRIVVEDVRGRTRNSQHIVVDTTRRAAVLEAFKVSRCVAVSMLTDAGFVQGVRARFVWEGQPSSDLKEGRQYEQEGPSRIVSPPLDSSDD